MFLTEFHRTFQVKILNISIIKDENVWKKGKGVLTGPQYIKLTPLNDGTYILEAWVKFAILPGVYVGEMGITGFFGAIPKSFLKARVEMIFQCLNAQMLPMPSNGANAYLNQTQPQQYVQQANPYANQQANPYAQQQSGQPQTNPYANQQANPYVQQQNGQPQQMNPYANQQANTYAQQQNEQPQQTNPFFNQQ